MHELGLLHAVVIALEQAVDRRGARGVAAVGLRVGSRSGAMPEALFGAWPLASGGTCAEGAHLEVEPVQAAVWCPKCQADHEIDRFFAWTCPRCGTPTAHLVRGREFEVAWAELKWGADHADPAATC